MQTRISPEFQATAAGTAADAILRKCVHCGFCLATCPTYALLGDERDSPRGRIYLLKQLFEGEPVTERTQRHLDRCLGCRACETTCPSGVEYGALLRIGRPLVADRVTRQLPDRLRRAALRVVLGRRPIFGALLMLGRAVRPLLPQRLRLRIPHSRPARAAPTGSHARRVVLLRGCVQPSIAPSIDAAARVVLDRLGFSTRTAARAGCCGGVAEHLGSPEEARALARRNIDAWWPLLEAGATAIVATASACALQVREYGALLRDDAAYRDRAARVSELAGDISAIVHAERERLGALLPAVADGVGTSIVFHAPCTLQHGLRVRGTVEELLRMAGFRLVVARDAHFCCGSAGPYSLLEPELGDALLERKIADLMVNSPTLIATANIGCLAHLERRAHVPVRHWIELLADRIAEAV
jgi:glycolate oxidase iron-sulfur subunit